MLSARTGRLLTAARQEARRQVTARYTRARQPAPAPGYARARVRRVPVTVRLDPGMMLERQRQAFAATVVEVLKSRGIPFWWVPGFDGKGRVLCVRVEHREALLSGLVDRAEPSWYFDALDAQGRPAYYHLAGAAAARLKPPGLLVWEFVAASPTSSFLSDRRQGVTTWFWEADDEGVLTSLVANQVVEALPASVCPGDGSVPVPLQHRPTSTVGFPVDVVYTWVDGADDAWVRSKAQAAGVADPAVFTERAHDASRFADHDELRYSLRALEQFAPWVNHVWIVTAGQHPSWLRRDDPWVSVVDHRDVWPDERGLPTFNSHAIEACLHRVPGLAEHFVYLNDDMLLARPVAPENFFHPSGIGKFFWSNALVDHLPPVAGEIASSTAAKNARRLLAERYGVSFSRKFFHTGAALTVSGMAELEATFPDVIDRTRQAAFRTVDDVAMAGSLYLNWAYVTGRAVPSRLRYTYIDPAAPDAAQRLATLTRKRVFDAICVNDGSTEETVEQRLATDRLIRAFFAGYLPVPGTFETVGPAS